MLFDRTLEGGPIEAIERLGAAADARVLWLLTDLFPFSNRDMLMAIGAAFVKLTETELQDDGRLTMINRLIAWDVPAFPGLSRIQVAPVPVHRAPCGSRSSPTRTRP